MSNVQAATKVADQLISRLFDHRHFTVGESNFLIKEFGGAKGTNLEDNLDRILKISENVCLIADSSSSDKCQSDSKTLQQIKSQVDLLHEKAENILKIQDEQREKETKLLHDVREERDKRKQDAYKRTMIKLEKLNESLMEEELNLERKFLMFEENLRKSNK